MMRGKRIIAAVGMFAMALAPNLMAQGKGGGIAIIPYGGYAIPGTLAAYDANDIQFESQPAMLLGLAIEFGLSKNMGIDIGANRTFSQTIDLVSGGTSQGEEDQTMTQIYGALVIRPGGRQPNGAVTPFFIEIGGGVTMYELCSAAAAGSCSDFNSTQPMGFAGAGYNFAIGPRATIQLFGRAQMIGPYSSTGLDAFNAAPPVTNVEGKSMFNFQIGAGLRVGR